MNEAVKASRVDQGARGHYLPGPQRQPHESAQPCSLTRVQVAMLGPLEVVTVHLPPRRGRCTQSFAYWLGVMPGAALNVRVKWA